MTRKSGNTIKNRLRGAWLTSVISISLVLFLVGFVVLLVLNAGKLSDYVKENIGFTIVLTEDSKDVDVFRLQKNLDATHYIKSTRYISKDDAAKELQAELGEDFVDFLGYNPLLNSIEAKLYANYANPDSLAWIELELKEYGQIKEIFYQKNLVHLVNENIKKISLMLLIFAGLLIIISIALLNNTIRLMIYSKRLIIHTMQLVGATRGFIRWPFIYSNILQGFISSIIAILFLSAIISYAEKELNALITLRDFELVSLVFSFVIIFSIILTSISTYFAVNRYLRMRGSDLY